MFPDVLYTKLKLSVPVNISTSGGATEFIMQANDPSRGYQIATGPAVYERPTFVNDIQVYYNYYVVTRATMFMEFQAVGTNQAAQALIVASPSSFAGTAAEVWQGIPDSNSKACMSRVLNIPQAANAGNARIFKLRKTCRTADVCGVNKVAVSSLERFQGSWGAVNTLGTGPVQPWYFNFALSNVPADNTTACQITGKVTLTYYVRCFGRKVKADQTLTPA